MDLISVQIRVTDEKQGNRNINTETEGVWLLIRTYFAQTHLPANKQVWFILNKTLQLNTVVPQSIFSLHTVTEEEAEGHINGAPLVEDFI